MKAFEYGVCRHPDEEIYIKQRQLLLKNIPGLTFVEELVDVDESKFSIMIHERGRVVLKNSFFLNEVCIESDFDISPYMDDLGLDWLAATEYILNSATRTRKSANRKLGLEKWNG